MRRDGVIHGRQALGKEIGMCLVLTLELYREIEHRFLEEPAAGSTNNLQPDDRERFEMKTLTLLAAGAAFAVGLGAGAAKAGTLADVQKRGTLVCGVNGPGLTGFGIPDDQGHWRGLDVDVCRAVASAVFGDDTKVKYVPLGPKERFTALQSGEIDLLVRNSTWTFSRETDLGLEFVAVNYYAGQGFMVRKELGVDSALKLSGATICVQTGTTTEKNLADWFPRAERFLGDDLRQDDVVARILELRVPSATATTTGAMSSAGHFSPC
jgi:hypothetical protein